MTTTYTTRTVERHQVAGIHRIPDYRNNAGTFPVPQAPKK